MSLDNRTKHREYQGYKSKVKVTGPDYRIFHHCEIGQKACVHDNWWTVGPSLMIFCMSWLPHEPYLISRS